jgi:hypothetical protein
VAVLAGGARAFRCGLLLLSLVARGVAAAPAPTEEQVKAVFVFNFSHFVEWPPQTFASPGDPFIIGVLGEGTFGSRLEEAVQGEKIDQHVLTVRRFHSIADVKDCQILYIDKTQIGQLRQIIASLGHRSTLTVADAEKSAERGVMMQFVTESNRIRLRINVEAAREAGLTISSKLLRPAEIVAAAGGD